MRLSTHSGPWWDLGLITSEISIDTVCAPNARGILTRNSLLYNDSRFFQKKQDSTIKKVIF